MNNRGFTLVELLASLALIALLFLLVTHMFRNTMASSETQLEQVVSTETFSAANSYIIENNLPYNLQGYLCLAVEKLVESGYLKANRKDDRSIKVTRNNQTKVIEKMEYVDICY